MGSQTLISVLAFEGSLFPLDSQNRVNGSCICPAVRNGATTPDAGVREVEAAEPDGCFPEACAVRDSECSLGGECGTGTSTGGWDGGARDLEVDAPGVEAYCMEGSSCACLRLEGCAADAEEYAVAARSGWGCRTS